MVLEDSDVEMIVAELEVTVSRLLSLFDTRDALVFYFVFSIQSYN